jgi:hypothetical protein
LNEAGDSAKVQNETSALVLASAASTPKPDIAIAGEKGLTSRLGLQKGFTRSGFLAQAAKKIMAA